MNKIFIILLVGVLAYAIGRNIYFKPKFRNGEDIPEIKSKLMNGQEFSLEELRGKFVLLDFWGSWCAPCRKENPALVELYNKYDSDYPDQFKIVSVAIETNEENWKRAIQKDGLNWPYHIVQLDRFQSPIAKSFGVREIPTKYLINRKGKIIAVNTTIKEIDRILTERI